MKPKLYVITLEPLDSRYTLQWYKYWKKEFSKWYSVTYIDGKDVGEIKKGRFLDINNTNVWKAQQVQKIAELFDREKIKKNSIFIFMDGWHFGITALKYMSQLNNIPVKIYAYWHAGSWDEYDFITQAGLRKWACLNEAGWFRALDGSFVATEFHKKLIVDYFNTYIDSKKVHVVGFPMDWKYEIKKLVKKRTQKEDIVVFPHRLDKEKNPQVFDTIAKNFIGKAKFVKTVEVTKNKKEYYNLLQKAKIIFSANDQETFGIGTVEALMLGCIPIVPNKLAYKELYYNCFKYNTFSEAVDMIDGCLRKRGYLLNGKIQRNKEKIQKQSEQSIFKMYKVMRNGRL